MGVITELTSLKIIGIFSILSSFIYFPGLSTSPLTPILCASLSVELHGPPLKSPYTPLHCTFPVSQSSFQLDWWDFLHLFVFLIYNLIHSQINVNPDGSYRGQTKLSSTYTVNFLLICVFGKISICYTSPWSI